MKKLKKGLAGAISGIALGFLLTLLVNYLVKIGTLPQYSVWLLGLFNIIGNILTLNYCRSAGLLYSSGWLAASFLFINLLGTLDVLFNILGPVLILMLRMTLWLAKSLKLT